MARFYTYQINALEDGATKELDTRAMNQCILA